jgi:hypothetical protein
MKADTFHQRVWANSELVTKAKEIEECLDFLNGPNHANRSIKDFSLLNVECEQTMSPLKATELGNSAANNFKILIEACQEVYNTGETAKKTGVSMLFQAIFSKSSFEIKRITRLLKRGDGASNNNATNGKSLDYFLHADRSQAIVSDSLGVM